MNGALWGAALGLGLSLLVIPARRRAQDSSTSSRPLIRSGAWIKHGAISVACGVVMGAVAWLVTGAPGIVIVAGATASLAPTLMGRVRRASSARARDGAWPHVVDQLMASLRSGGTVTHAVMNLSDFRVPVIRRGARVYATAVTTTANVDGSLSLLADEWDHDTGDRVVAILRLAHDVGGPGAVAALADLSRDIHREALIRADIRARHSWLRVATWVGLAAPWVVVAFLGSRPEGRVAYASPTGTFVLIAGYALTLIAYLIMSRVARSERPLRVFRS